MVWGNTEFTHYHHQCLQLLQVLLAYLECWGKSKERQESQGISEEGGNVCDSKQEVRRVGERERRESVKLANTYNKWSSSAVRPSPCNLISVPYNTGQILRGRERENRGGSISELYEGCKLHTYIYQMGTNVGQKLGLCMDRKK